MVKSKTRPLSIRVPNEVYDVLTDIASETDDTVNGVVRQMLVASLIERGRL